MRILIANYRYFVSSGPERYLFNVKSKLEARGHEVMPFSIRYSMNEPSPYERYFASPLAGPDQVFFDQHKSSLSTSLKTVSRPFYSREVERAVLRMVDETKPDIAYVLYYLRKLSPSLLVGLQERGIRMRDSDLRLRHVLWRAPYVTRRQALHALHRRRSPQRNPLWLRQEQPDDLRARCRGDLPSTAHAAISTSSTPS
ncbi:hypothetical protein AB5I41_17460 [Sphingomonas sp. MMS24-JH45]